MKLQVRNSKGELVKLNKLENHRAQILQRMANDLGYEIDITSLTTIIKRITEQKFFEIAPADYVPVRVGEGAWSSQLTTYRSFEPSDSFDTGIMNTGGNSSRMAMSNAAVDSLSILVKNWAKGNEWTIMDLEQAAKSGNWDLVTSKEKSRKRNWDLGIQRVAFLGLKNDSSVLGLYTQAGITTDAGVVIPTPISAMNPTQLKAFLEAILPAYRSNAQFSAWPTHFIIPESDYLGLAAPASSDFPIRSTLSLLEETFQIMTKNKNFKILPNAYGMTSNSGGALAKNRYILTNYDEESIRMDIPVDYTNTLANSLNNFSFQNAGYGQFTGVLAYRPRELLYLDLP